MVELSWLETQEDWQKNLALLAADAETDRWPRLVSLANARINFVETVRLDRSLQKYFNKAPPRNLTTVPVRLAVLGASTTEHLIPGIRIGALRRNLWLSAYTTAYGQYFQELLDPKSGLHAFAPTAILFAFDPAHLLTESSTDDDVEARLVELWRLARKNFACAIYQQTLTPVAHALLGNNEHRLPSALRRRIARMNERLRALANEHQIHLLAIDDHILIDGLSAWHDPLYWHKAKQDIAPVATPMYGDLLARMLAAAQGRSYKCLVLDLDNTLWGGVIGDDGLDGIKLGQGSAVGEAYLAVQRYALALSRRGVILAVCSKNDEANALAPFQQHPEMLLKPADIACFVANWNDKASNLRLIAERLNIGLDALVFLDDNPFERNIVRRELPMVAVPELPADPAHYVTCLASAGYFEALTITDDDLARAQQYQANTSRETLRASSTDIDSYLKSLEMELHAAPFDPIGLPRIVQLINKTNQFNLTTRRYTAEQAKAVSENPEAFTLQLRLVDKFGDNGIIGIVIGFKENDAVRIDTWLMSCRVLGRGVEQETLNLVIEEAGKLGAKRLIGEFIPTAKNAMVRDMYPSLGFQKDESAHETGAVRWTLPLKAASVLKTHIAMKKAA